MGGYFDGTLGSDPVHQDRPHHGARLIDLSVSVRDEAVVERLASELKACGCEVRVHTEEQYDELKT
jgi:hypothetical protein